MRIIVKITYVIFFLLVFFLQGFFDVKFYPFYVIQPSGPNKITRSGLNTKEKMFDVKSCRAYVCRKPN